MTKMTKQNGGSRASSVDVVALQRHQRKDNNPNLFPHGATGAAMPWRHDMSLMIEDLARDRMREMQRDSERLRQIRKARLARRSARAATSER